MIESFKRRVIGAFLHGFRNTQQFLEIKLSSDSYEEIIFFIDCKISCSDEKINNIVSVLNEVDSDVSEITFFIPSNNKEIVNVIYTSKILELTFSNNYSVYFHLDSDVYDEPLSVSMRERKYQDKYDSIDFCSEGIRFK